MSNDTKLLIWETNYKYLFTYSSRTYSRNGLFLDTSLYASPEESPRSTIYLNEEPFSDDINSVSCAKYAKPLFCDYIGCFVNDLFSLLKSLPLQPLHWRPCLLRQIMCHFFQLWVLKLLPHAYFKNLLHDCSVTFAGLIKFVYYGAAIHWQGRAPLLFADNLFTPRVASAPTITTTQEPIVCWTLAIFE